MVTKLQPTYSTNRFLGYRWFVVNTIFRGRNLIVVVLHAIILWREGLELGMTHYKFHFMTS